MEVSRCHRGVQASARDAEAARLASALAAAAEERERRQRAEAQLAAERAARLAAIAELDRNSQRLLDLAGAGESILTRTLRFWRTPERHRSRVACTF